MSRPVLGSGSTLSPAVVVSSPWSISSWRIHLRNVSGVIPNLLAVARIASHSDAQSRRGHEPAGSPRPPVSGPYLFGMRRTFPTKEVCIPGGFSVMG
jgi:hypothetical protein